MTQVNMLQAKSDLSKLVKLVESGDEDYIAIARNGVPVAKIIAFKEQAQRIGVAKGKMLCTDDFDKYDDEIAEMFEV